ncbi:MAG: hypothetical protein VX223_11205 [Myxococcota bacterium]|nr:hypothetical protein [Myxococcota bacterium]
MEPEATLRAVRSYGSLVELLRCRVMASNALGHSEDAATALSSALRLATEHELEHALPALHALEKGA